MLNHTICALATPQGSGAIAVIRLSGALTYPILHEVFKPKNNVVLADAKGYSIVFGTIHKDNELLDEVLISLFKAPYSYTGEDSVEISCHASPYIIQNILALLTQKGARIATPGEYTQRAYFNGKLDLSQAEAVADVIASESKAAHNLAMRQMKGGISDEINNLREQLINFASLVELELDFSEEDVEFADRTQLESLINTTLSTVNRLINSFTLGNAIKKGIPVTIVGAPNAGKSTLLNALLKENRAIVSDIAGTTRDTIEDEIVLNGVSYRFVDTAGIRETDDVIEKLGIDRTFESVKKAAIVLWLVDAQLFPTEEEYKSLELLLKEHLNSEQRLIPIANKTDKAGITMPAYASNFISISAKENIGLDALEKALEQSLEAMGYGNASVAISSTRHLDALTKTKESLDKVLEGMALDISGDLLAMDIRQALHYLGEITGAVSTDDLLGNIFSKFCIGK